jgi:hypothetical protein
MKKYNLSEIMKSAWELFKTFKNVPADINGEKHYDTFAKCLKKAWSKAKEALTAVRMTEGQYKREFANCKTVEGSYSDKFGTVEVLVGESEKARLETVERIPYSLYKREYEDCRTVADSYDKATKTIEVYVNLKKAEARYHTVQTKRYGRWNIA